MSVEELMQVCRTLVADENAAGIAIVTQYDSVSATVTPPAGTIAKGENPDAFFGLPDGTRGCSLDSWGSQANRFEAALLRNIDTLGLPLITLVGKDVAGSDRDYGNSLTWSHRQASATYRFAKPEIAKADVPVDDIAAATPYRADALMKWFPQSLLFGWWDSHSAANTKEYLERAKAAKLPANEQKRVTPTSVNADDRRSARMVTSEIIAKGVALRTRYAAIVDPVFGPVKTGAKGTGDKDPLYQLGFGSMQPQSAPKDVTFATIEGTTYVSLTRMRQFKFADADRTEDYQVVLVLLALAGIIGAQRDLHLRSGTDLIARSQTTRIVRHLAEPTVLDLPDFQTVADAVRAATNAAGLTWQQVTVDVSGIQSFAQIANSRNDKDEKDDVK